ncbi:MAG: DNA translocase FtsK 4TM domain-containing protein, partial [bacterium]
MTTETMDKLAAIRRRALSLALAFAALFLLFSLLTFDRGDLPQASWPRPEVVRNVGGRAGVLVANYMMLHFGYASYVAVLLAAGFAVRSLLQRDVVEAWLGVFGCVLMLASSAALFQLISPSTESVPGGGGVVGIAAVGVARHYAGSLGAWLLLMLLFGLGALLMGVDDALEWVGRRALAGSRMWWVGRRERSAAAATSGGQAGVEAAEPPIKTHRAASVPAAGTATAEPPTADAAPEPEAPPATEEPPPARTDTAPDEKKTSIDRIAVVPSRVVDGGYELPPTDLLDPPEPFDERALEKLIRENSRILERTLSEFGIGAQVVGIEKGPSVTRYELALAPGIKVNRVSGLSDDIAMAVKAPSVRVVAPIPGKSTVGIEVPNAMKEFVRLVELLTCDGFRAKRDRMILPILLGKDASGTPIINDLTRMPHLLIAGATGSGKSVCLNAFLVTTLMLHRPERVRLILVDPKMVDLGLFEGIPHLLTPVVTDMKRAPYVLEWATRQMDERYDWLARVGVRHIAQYNQLGAEGIRERLGEDCDDEEDEVPLHMPYVVIVVDELADMMMVASKEVEVSITRLAQKSRAVGIHIILATQRPSVDVITGLIKSNLPA